MYAGLLEARCSPLHKCSTLYVYIGALARLQIALTLPQICRLCSPLQIVLCSLWFWKLPNLAASEACPHSEKWKWVWLQGEGQHRHSCYCILFVNRHSVATNVRYDGYQQQNLCNVPFLWLCWYLYFKKSQNFK